MPIRITCPSCSATLSVKDEFAGRAVKCPKCGGVIPPAQPAPADSSPSKSSPAVAPEPEAKPAPEVGGEAAKPKTGGRVVGKPVPHSTGRGENEDEEDRPRRKRGEDERGEKGDRRDRDRDDDDDRPRRRRRDDDRRDRGGKKEGGGSSGVMIVAILCGTLLLCCGGVGFGVYWFVIKVKETVEKGAEDFQRAMSPVTRANYNQLRVGATTLADAERILGSGKSATDADVMKAFARNGDHNKRQTWSNVVAQNRAVVWKNGDDYLFAAFHPNAEPTSRLQMKEWRAKEGEGDFAGEPNDAAFLQKYPPPKPGKTGEPPTGGPAGGGKDEEPPPGTDFIEVDAVALTKEYKDTRAAADAKYKGKWLIVEGKVEYVDPGDDRNKDDVAGVRLEGAGAGGGKLEARCYALPDQAGKVLNLTRGQSARFKGKCAGSPTGFVRLDHCRVESAGDDPAIKTSAGALILEFAKDRNAANEKYKDKETFVTNAEFVSAAGSLATFKAGKAPITLQANFTFRQDEKLANLKPGDKVKFKARAGLLFGEAPKQYVSFYDAYLVP